MIQHSDSTRLISTKKKAKSQARKMASSTASAQDVCTRKPQPPSKPVPRKTIGQRMAEVATTGLQDLKGTQRGRKAK